MQNSDRMKLRYQTFERKQQTMSEKIVQLNEEVIKRQIKKLVCDSVEETLNELLKAEAEKLTQAPQYERSEQCQSYHSGHYSRTSLPPPTTWTPLLKPLHCWLIYLTQSLQTSLRKTLALPSLNGFDKFAAKRLNFKI